MIKIKQIRLLCVILIFIFIYPKLGLSWVQTYGGAQDDYGLSALRVSDGYVIVGGTESYSAGGDEDVYLVKTAFNGNYVWHKNIGNVSRERGKGICQAHGGGYVIIGYKEVGVNNYDIYVIRTDAGGGIVWERTYGWACNDFGYSVKPTSDGHYIICGSSQPVDVFHTSIYLAKINHADGGEVWQKFIGDDNLSEGGYMEMTSDGGCIITGTRGGNVCLIKVDSSGGFDWEKSFGGTKDDRGYSVKQTFDGYYIITGYTVSLGPYQLYSDFYLIKTDSSGNMIWENHYGGVGDHRGYSVFETSDRGYIVGGSSAVFGCGGYLVKTDSDGTMLWEKCLSTVGLDVRSVQQISSDDSYIIAGLTSGFGWGNCNAFLVNDDCLAPDPDPASFQSVTVDSPNQITWTSAIGSDPMGGVKYSFEGSSLNSGWISSYIYTRNDLLPNTKYSLRLRMKDDMDNIGGYSAYANKYTLAAAANLKCNVEKSNCVAISTFYFTNKNVFRAGGVEYYRYMWASDSTYHFVGGELQWESGVLELSVPENQAGERYLHIISYNNAGVTNGQKRYGPYLFDTDAPDPGKMETIEVDTNQIMWQAKKIEDGVKYKFEGSFESDWQTTNVFIISNLSPNKKYFQKVSTIDDISNQGGCSPLIYRYTLPASPNIASDKTDGIQHKWPVKEEFIFTNKQKWGTGGVEYYRYKWIKSKTYEFKGEEEKWGKGELVLDGKSLKQAGWYLHLQSYNGDDIGGDTKVFGPYGAYNIMKEMKIANYPNPFDPNSEKTAIEWYLEKDSKVKVIIYSINGKVLKSWDFQTGREGGKQGLNRIRWDGRNDKGYIVANGVYFCYIMHNKKENMVKIAVVK